MTRPRDIADSINRINSSAADATAVTIDSSEQVGIGTTSPDTLLNLESAAPTMRLAPTTQNNSASIELGVLNGGTNAYAKIDSHNTTNYDSNIRFFTNAAGSTTQVERMRILSGGGITFNGDTATANALDDYEEGSWTPGITGMTYEYAGGVYTKIGRRVQCSGFLINCTSGTASAVGAFLSGLPFTVANNLSTTALEDGGVMHYYNNLARTTSSITIAPDDSSTECFLYFCVGASTGLTSVLRTDVDASNFSCRFFFTYISTS